MKKQMHNTLPAIKAIAVAALMTVTTFTAIQSQANVPLNGRPFQQLQTQVDDLQTQLNEAVTQLQSQIDDANALIDQLFSVTGENSQDIDDLQTYVDILENQLNLLQGNLATDCGDGYFIQKINSDGTPVCGKDMGNGYVHMKEVAVAPGVPYFPAGMKCPASHPRIISGGYAETPTTGILGSLAAPSDSGEDSWVFLLNGIGAIALSITCSTN